MTKDPTTSASPLFNREELIKAFKIGIEVLQFASPQTQQSMIDTLNESESFRYFVYSSKKVNE